MIRTAFSLSFSEKSVRPPDLRRTLPVDLASFLVQQLGLLLYGPRASSVKPLGEAGSGGWSLWSASHSLLTDGTSVRD